MAEKNEVYVNLRIERSLHEEVIREVGRSMVENPSVRYTKSDFIRDAIRHFLNTRKQKKQEPNS